MINNKTVSESLRIVLVATGFALLCLLPGCSTTVESKLAAAQALESGGPLPSAVTGFLGPDAATLTPGLEGGAALGLDESRCTMAQLYKDSTDAA